MAVLAADAARRVAAKRHVGAVRCAAVDADEAGAQPAGDRQRALQRTRHDVAGEPVGAGVRDPDRVRFVLERDDGEHRTEDLLLGDRHVVVDVDEQRGLDPEPLVAAGGRVGAADEELGTLVDALLDVAEDALALFGRDHGAAQRPRILRIADGDGVVHSLEDPYSLAVARPREQQPGRNGAALASVHAGRDPDQTGKREVGVLQHDGGGLASQLEEQALHRRRALFHDPPADGGRAREGNQIDLRRERELFPDEVVGCGDDVHHPGWNVRALGDQAPEARRVEGVSGAGFSTTVLPVASAWPSLLIVTSNGKFHGTIAPTTPTGSRHTFRLVSWPVSSTNASPRSVSHGYSSISLAGYVSALPSGASSCGPCVTMRGQPASRMSSSRSSSFSASSASCNCSRHRLRKARLVDQSVSSKARRAASIARCMSAFDASATCPNTSSVAGLILTKVPACPSTSLPSISILDSKRSCGVSVTLLTLFRWGVVDRN